MLIECSIESNSLGAFAFKQIMKKLIRTLVSRVYNTIGKPQNAKPISGLVPDNLYAYLDALHKKRALPGVVLEVGCYRGATTAIAFTFLARQGIKKEYICIDTFDGFREEHIHVDRLLGLVERNFSAFNQNSKEDVNNRLVSWGISQVKLVQGDISALPDDQLPQNIMVCLLDVDLKVPIYEGLKRIYPNLVPGGVILVDDCTDGTSWVGAIHGYKQFVNEYGLSEKYFMSFGVVEKDPEIAPLNWSFSSIPSKETHYFFRSANPIK